MASNKDKVLHHSSLREPWIASPPPVAALKPPSLESTLPPPHLLPVPPAPGIRTHSGFLASLSDKISNFTRPFWKSLRSSSLNPTNWNLPSLNLPGVSIGGSLNKNLLIVAGLSVGALCLVYWLSRNSSDQKEDSSVTYPGTDIGWVVSLAIFALTLPYIRQSLSMR